MVAWAPIIMGASALYSAFSKKKKGKKGSTLDKNQQQLWNQQNQGINGQGPLANLYNFDANKGRENFMQNYGDPAYQNYQENVVPQVTGAFRSKGLGNSTYAGQALARSGRDVQNNINSQMTNYLYNQEQSANDRRSNAVNSALNLNTQTYERPNASFLDNIMNGAGTAAGKYASNKLFG